MDLVVYAHWGRLVQPTGVGKHIRNMVTWLAREPGVRARYLSVADSPEAVLLEHGLSESGTAVRLPSNRSTIEWRWHLLGRPLVDHWIGSADWIYCPMEAYVPSRRARLAVTIHCLNQLDRDVPWYSDRRTRWQRWRWRLSLPRIIRQSDLLLAVSDFLKQKLIEWFHLPDRKIAVVGNGAEDEYFQAAVDETLPGPDCSDPPYVMVVGGLTQRKGGAWTLEVARRLAQLDSSLRIRVAGDSESEFLAAARAQANVELMGYRGLDELPGLMKGAVALLFLSRYETFGIPAVEAMAAGTPPIVSHYAALPQVVGAGGFVVDPADGGAIAELVLRLARDRSFRAEHSRRARNEAERHRWEVCAQRAFEAMRSHA